MFKIKAISKKTLSFLLTLALISAMFCVAAISASADSGNIVHEGDTITVTYEIDVKNADWVVENFDIKLVYDSKILKIEPKLKDTNFVQAYADRADVTFNAGEAGVIYANCSRIYDPENSKNGLDFVGGNVLVTLTFEAIATGDPGISLEIKDLNSISKTTNVKTALYAGFEKKVSDDDVVVTSDDEGVVINHQVDCPEPSVPGGAIIKDLHEGDKVTITYELDLEEGLVLENFDFRFLYDHNILKIDPKILEANFEQPYEDRASLTFNQAPTGEPGTIYANASKIYDPDNSSYGMDFVGGKVLFKFTMVAIADGDASIELQIKDMNAVTEDDEDVPLYAGYVNVDTDNLATITPDAEAYVVDCPHPGDTTEPTTETTTKTTEPTTEKPGDEMKFYIAGEEGLVGIAWDPAGVQLNKVAGEENLYSVTFTGVAPGTYAYKITTGGWDENAGHWAWNDKVDNGDARFNGANATVTVGEDSDGTVTVFFKFCPGDEAEMKKSYCWAEVEGGPAPTTEPITEPTTIKETEPTTIVTPTVVTPTVVTPTVVTPTVVTPTEEAPTVAPTTGDVTPTTSAKSSSGTPNKGTVATGSTVASIALLLVLVSAAGAFIMIRKKESN